jgi:hypothetical protein
MHTRIHVESGIRTRDPSFLQIRACQEDWRIGYTVTEIIECVLLLIPEVHQRLELDSKYLIISNVFKIRDWALSCSFRQMALLSK